MDLSTLPLVGPLLHGGADLLAATTAALSPVAGGLAAAIAVVLLTVAVRAVLLPLAVLQVRAERDRRRLAPQIAALRKRYAEDRERMQRALQELYTNEKVSPLAGCLPVLAQAPVLSLVYALFTHASIGGVTNTLLSATLAGVPLGHSLVVVLTSPLWAHAWVVVLLLAVLAVVVELTRRANLRWNPAAVPDAAVPGAAATAAIGRYAPFVTVVFAAIAPLAAALYVVTSAAWTYGERAVLRRVLA
ncbi:YidC/Oxa1 family membrane protein insertase [Curtobacterium sp. 314Chir4.1]|uniref:YidC/Oxa1 family membrane protein insertase n=1 Tax=Curtobacterium sp. 314Chir4.1 TaxID=1279028 RepID=UPI000BCCFDFC|nr:membrane protein insertase YidC [Curtobacterium sp. 314Chir4.1]SOC86808.1 YidC/Oxa1 family membrane protein insertase [Curtobacterium sp. 314Chir4.1]